jgi:hypothetical protein
MRRQAHGWLRQKGTVNSAVAPASIEDVALRCLRRQRDAAARPRGDALAEGGSDGVPGIAQRDPGFRTSRLGAMTSVLTAASAANAKCSGRMP